MNPKEFKPQFIDDMTNKKWAAEVEIDTQKEILMGQESTKDRILDWIKVSQDSISELEKDPSREARDKRKIEEKKLEDLKKKLIDQQGEIDKTNTAIEKWSRQAEILAIYLRVAEKHK